MKSVKFITNKTSFFISNFENIADGLNQNKYKVFLSTPDVSADNIGQMGRYCDYKQTTLKRNNVNVLSLLKFMYSIKKEQKSENNTVYCLITILPVLFAGLVLRQYNKKLLLIITGMGTVFSSNKLRHKVLKVFVKLIYRYILSGENVFVITQNSEDFDYFLRKFKFTKKKLYLVKGCGADPEKFIFKEKKFNEDSPVILVPARIIKEKGILEAAEASYRLDQLNIKHEMWFSSEIDYDNPLALTKHDIEELIKKCRNIKFLGHQDSVVPAMEACDIVCLPTYREGLPTAVVEATAVGRVVITTDTIGCRDVIKHNETGLLVNVGDYKGIVDAVIELKQNRELRERLIKNAYIQYLNEFTKDIIWGKTYKVFKDMEQRG